MSRASRDRIILFVNGRAIQDSALSHAVTQAYDGLLRAGRFPCAVLLVKTPADFVDVNVHPTKAEVRFRDAHLVFLAVQRAVREALLGSSDSAPASDLWSTSGFSDQYINAQRPQPSWTRFSEDKLFDDADLDYIPVDAEQPSMPRTLPVLRVVGQIGASYIVAEGPAGLYLVDQNAAHERLLYEQMRGAMANGGIQRIAPAESQTIMLSPEDAALLAEVGELLSVLGFEIEVFGPNTFVVRAMPTCVEGLSLSDVLPHILSGLRKSAKTDDDGIAALSAVAAVRRGQILDAAEMATLIAQLERCPSPLTAPGGRKTFVHLSREQLADEFRRV